MIFPQLRFRDKKEIKELDLETKRNLKVGFNCHVAAP